jgi:hypothetical protein
MPHDGRRLRLPASRRRHDLDVYRRFQAEKLARIAAVQSLKTDIPLQRIKVTAALPL